MSGLGSAVSSIFGGIGDFEEASGYGKAAGYADQQAGYAKLSTGIQETQTARQIYQVAGATESAAGGNNMSLSGSAQDVLRGNTQQGTLQRSLVGLQGLITETGYKAQAASDRAMANAAQMAGVGGIAGGVLSLFGF